jgi:glycosyltransferase involved in cell wall biosynthesis
MAGAGVYTYQLVRALAEVSAPRVLFIFARPGLFDDVASEHVRVIAVESASPATRLAWEQLHLPFLLRRLRIDVLHSPHHHTPAAVRGTARVVTLHDVTFLLLPNRYPPLRRYYMQSLTWLSSRIADAIITPSDTVARDVTKALRAPDDRVVSIHEAPGPQYRPVGTDAQREMRRKHQLPDRYVLSVGSLEPGKNRGRLIRAYSDATGTGNDCPLIIVGQPAWQYEADYHLVRQLHLDQRVRFLGYVPDDDLPAMYSAATAFAYPSLYEGFGLPVLEAMACGTPVLTSNTSATAEVAGDAALLVDPWNEHAIQASLSRLLTDDALQDELRQRGFKRAAQFSWDRTARETLAIYEAAVSG